MAMDTSIESQIELGQRSLTLVRHCAGRFELELPKDMTLLEAGYGQPEFSIDMYAEGDKTEGGLYRGEQRLEQWLSYIDKKRQKDSEFSPTEYVIQELKPHLKTVSFHADIRGLMDDDNAPYSFTTYFFQDFPEQQMGLSIQGLAIGHIPRNVENVQETFNSRVTWMKEAISETVIHQPWPHNQFGICMPNGILINNSSPVQTQQGYFQENYAFEFFNGKKSIFRLLVVVYSDETALKQEISQVSGLLSFIASSKTKVAGRNGRLFINDGKYSDTEREFKWVSTDSKVNSVRFAHIEIEGKIEIDDYPELKPLNATDMVVALINGVRVRENGMEGVKR
ncbi:hypothetical protein GCE9029_01144 [Grimontia celer]|uniref:Uncharacterized protein n=2 Tax=Grimontia celer TaxID=1796497 RepID=A0A128EWF3_9GAMM|nr:hypothetical protein GCE9029_01144 [Grimontia celer]